MSISKPFQRIHCVVALALSALATSAQQLPVDPVPVPPTNSYRYAAKRLDAAADDNFTRTLTGYFNDDAQPDVFVRRRSSAHLFVDPTIWDAALGVTGVVRGMGRLTGTAPNGRDELVGATPSGLRAWARDSLNGVFNVRTLGDDLLWAHVELLTTANLDSQFGDDVVGIAPGGGQAIVLMSQAGGTFAPELTFALPFPPLAVVACDFGGTGQKQLVFLGQTTVKTTTWDGQPRSTLSVSGSAVATVVRKGTGLRQRVAWIADDGAGDVLRLLDTQVAEVLLGNIDAVGITRWDHDKDGDDDLAISHQAGWNLRLLTNVGNAFNTVAQKVLVTGPSGAADTNVAWPTVADLDGDGDEDVFIPVQVDEMIFVHRGEAIEHRDFLPELLQPVYFNHGSFEQGSLPRGYLQVRAAGATAVPPDATHMELVLWRKDDPDTSTDRLPEQGRSFLFLKELAPYYTGIIDYEAPDLAVYFWMQRYVKVVNDEVEHAYPAAIYALTADSPHGGDVLTYLLEIEGAEIHCETTPDTSFENFNHSRTTSTIIRLTPIVDYEENEEPETDP